MVGDERAGSRKAAHAMGKLTFCLRLRCSSPASISCWLAELLSRVLEPDAQGACVTDVCTRSQCVTGHH